MLKLIIWDVQHGSAAYLKTPNGKHIAIDLGANSLNSWYQSFSPLRHLRTNYHITQLDDVIITHPHLDHIEDILNFELLSPKVLHRPSHLNAEAIWSNNQNADRDIRQRIEKYLEIDQRYREPIPPGYDFANPLDYGGVDVKIFSSAVLPTTNINNHSLVTVISYENCKVLFPGDNERLSWEQLLLSPDFHRAISDTDILIAPHHGRDSGFYDGLFNFINPLLTVISDGRFSDMSATGRYGAVTRGWTVHCRRGFDQNRKCITTRNDGVIEIDIGRDMSNGRSFISVNID